MFNINRSRYGAQNASVSTSRVLPSRLLKPTGCSLFKPLVHLIVIVDEGRIRLLRDKVLEFETAKKEVDAEIANLKKEIGPISDELQRLSRTFVSIFLFLY